MNKINKKEKREDTKGGSLTIEQKTISITHEYLNFNRRRLMKIFLNKYLIFSRCQVVVCI